MNLWRQRIDLLGTICGVTGALLSVLAVFLRLSLGGGNPPMVKIAPRSILWGAIAVMVFGCFLKLSALSRSGDR